MKLILQVIVQVETQQITAQNLGMQLVAILQIVLIISLVTVRVLLTRLILH